MAILNPNGGTYSQPSQQKPAKQGLSPKKANSLLTILKDMLKRDVDPSAIRLYINALGPDERALFAGLLTDEALVKFINSMGVETPEKKEVKFERAKLSPEAKRNLVTWYMIPSMLGTGAKAAGNIAGTGVSALGNMASIGLAGQGAGVDSRRDPTAAAGDILATGANAIGSGIKTVGEALAETVGNVAQAHNIEQALAQQHTDLQAMYESNNGMPINGMFEYVKSLNRGIGGIGR